MTFNTYIKTKHFRPILELRKSTSALFRLLHRFDLKIKAPEHSAYRIHEHQQHEKPALNINYTVQPKRKTEIQLNLPGKNGVTVVRWPGKTGGAFGFALTFLLHFLCQDKKWKNLKP